jgi:hypothetical protein
MLRAVVLHHAGAGDAVWVVARSAPRLEALAHSSRRLDGTVHPLAVDYHDTDELTERLAQVQRQFGAFDLVITWIHSTAPLAEKTVRSAVAAAAKTPVRCFRVLGSAGAVHLPEGGATNVLDHIIRLGYVTDGDRFRWLASNEIASGVIAAVAADTRESIIGRWPLSEAAWRALSGGT